MTSKRASPDGSGPGPAEAVLRIRAASLQFGSRPLWADLDLDVAPGELIAVLGPNGAGKTSLLRSILGQLSLTSGSIEFLGQPVRRGHPQIGYIPQQRIADRATPLRARDLVALGHHGNRFGPPLPRRSTRILVDQALAEVGALHLARVPVGRLSGGEQQRVRVGQALVGNPRLLLCDEPLSSLDLHHQRVISELLDVSRRRSPLGVVVITHDINPLLGVVDRVVYLAAGQARVGQVDDVLNSTVLSELYATRVDVLRTHNRVIVLGVPDDHESQLDAGGHHDEVPL